MVMHGSQGILKSSWLEVGPSGWIKKKNMSALQRILYIEQSEQKLDLEIKEAVKQWK